MRTRHSYDELLDEELLEPLPVVIDGATPTPTAIETIDALCARVLEVRGLGGLTPWLGPQSSMPQTAAPARPTTFGRIFELHPAHLEALPEWWRANARADRVGITPGLTLYAPRRTADGVWRMRASLRGPLPLRPRRMELTLWRHLGTWTKVTLEPRRRVRVAHSYFAAGHHALDVLCDRLAHELT